LKKRFSISFIDEYGDYQNILIGDVWSWSTLAGAKKALESEDFTMNEDLNDNACFILEETPVLRIERVVKFKEVS